MCDFENENLTNDFVSYIIKNNIDSVVIINSKSNEILSSIMKNHDLTEKRNFDHAQLSSQINLTHCKISFKPNLTRLVRDESSRKPLPNVATFSMASVENYALNLSPFNSKYAPDDKSILSSLLLTALNDKTLAQEKTVLVCK